MDSQFVLFAMVGVALVAIVAGITRHELADRRRLGVTRLQREQQRHVVAVLLGRGGAATALSEEDSEATGLTGEDWARLEAFRARARLLAATGEALGTPGWRARLRAARRDGHTALFVVAVLGSANLAMHFGAAALILGSSLLFAGVLTLFSTLVLAGVVVAVILDLLSSG